MILSPKRAKKILVVTEKTLSRPLMDQICFFYHPADQEQVTVSHHFGVSTHHPNV